MRHYRVFGLAAAALLAGVAVQPARAENVDLVGTFPAGARDVAMLRSIAVDRFAGRDGPELAAALERALLEAVVDGRPHFVVRPDASDAEGVVSGAVSTNVRSEDFTRRDEKCVERDAKKKCVRKEKVVIDCTRRVVAMSVDARVSDERDRRVAWAGAPARRVTTEWCRGDSDPPAVRGVVERMVGEIAGELRATFAPTTRRYSVRFRENTKGLDRDAARRFKDLVRQSQRDLRGACEGWAALRREAPDHVGTIFDLGVCAEAGGDLAAALALYERASQLLGPDNEAEADADRVRGLIAAQEDARRRS